MATVETHSSPISSVLQSWGRPSGFTTHITAAGERQEKVNAYQLLHVKKGWLDQLRLTSGHDGAHILQGEDRQLLLRVDPDHAVTQTLHGQDAATRGRAALLQRPAKSGEDQNRELVPRKGDQHDGCGYF